MVDYKYVRGFLGKEESERERERGVGRYMFLGESLGEIGLLAFAK